MSTETTIYSSKATWLDGDNVTTNYGNATTMKVGQQRQGFSDTERANAIFAFDVSSLTDPSLIVRAELQLTASGIGDGMSGNAERTIYAYRLDQDFTEDEATWNVADDDVDWTGGTTVGAANNSATTQYSNSARRKLGASDVVGFRVTVSPVFDVTELVKDGINRGGGTILIWIGIPTSTISTTSGLFTFHSNEAVTETNRPKLVIRVAEKIVWDGSAGDGNAQTASNWVGNVAPAVYDFALFNDGAVDVTSGAIVCNSLFIGEDYKGTIEETNGDAIDVLIDFTSGHPVQNKIVIDKKEGRFNLSQTSADVQIDTFVQNTPSNVDSKLAAAGADKQTVVVNRTGMALTLSGDAWKDIVLSNDKNGSRNIIIDATASPLISSKSKVIIESALGEFILSNGTKATVSTAGGAVATSGESWIVGNSRLTHRGTSCDNEINIANGRLSFKYNENPSIQTEDIVLWKKGVFDPRTDVGAWNVTASPSIVIRGGGDFLCDVGRTLTITN